MSTVGAVAATIAALVSIAALVLAFWWRRPHLEMLLGHDPAEGTGAKVFDLRLDNVGTVPVRVRVSLLVDGAPVGHESDPLTVVPALHRRFALALPLALFAEVEDGARLSARVRYGLGRTAEIKRGDLTIV